MEDDGKQSIGMPLLVPAVHLHMLPGEWRLSGGGVGVLSREREVCVASSINIKKIIGRGYPKGGYLGENKTGLGKAI